YKSTISPAQEMTFLASLSLSTINLFTMKVVSPEKRRIIAHALRNRPTTRDVASMARVSSSTVSKYRNLDAPELNLARGGRSRKISEAKKRQTKRLVLNGELSTIAAVHGYLTADGFDVSYSTASRVLKSMNLFSKIKKKKPFLANHHRIAGYIW